MKTQTSEEIAAAKICGSKELDGDSPLTSVMMSVSYPAETGKVSHCQSLSVTNVALLNRFPSNVFPVLFFASCYGR